MNETNDIQTIMAKPSNVGKYFFIVGGKDKGIAVGDTVIVGIEEIYNIKEDNTLDYNDPIGYFEDYIFDVIEVRDKMSICWITRGKYQGRYAHTRFSPNPGDVAIVRKVYEY